MDLMKFRTRKSQLLQRIYLGLKNLADLVYSPPKLPAHFETPGKVLPDTSLKDRGEFLQAVVEHW
jgi:hypothetical protein